MSCYGISNITECCCQKWAPSDFPTPAHMRSALGSDCVAAGVTFHTAFSRARLTLGMPVVFLTLSLVNPWNAHWSSSRSPEAQEKKQDRTLTTDSLNSWAHLFSTKSHPVSQSKCSGNPHLQAVAEMGAGAVQGWERVDWEERGVESRRTCG